MALWTTLATLAEAPSPLSTDSSCSPIISFVALTWNIEGLGRNILNLKHFIDRHQPDLVFLSEPQIFANDLDLVMSPLSGCYNASLNSADKFDPELPLLKSRASGGTLALWKVQHDPHITIFPASSAAFLPVIFNPPDSPLSIHIAVYLPTLGLESRFLEELSNLSVSIMELIEAHPGAPVYLRGDFNASFSNFKRTDLLDHFCSEHHLLQVSIPHPTYHHFLGNGQSDSFLDRILFSDSVLHQEILLDILCKNLNPLVDSHHDVIISSWSLPVERAENVSGGNIVAPRIENNRLKVGWSDEGIAEYQKMVVPHLTRIQELWLTSPSKTSVSLLLESTNNLLTSCAERTNKTFPLDKSSVPRPRKTPRTVERSKRALLKKYKKFKQACNNSSTDITIDLLSTKEEYNKARIEHRKLARSFKAVESWKRDEKLFSILSSDPSTLH